MRTSARRAHEDAPIYLERTITISEQVQSDRAARHDQLLAQHRVLGDQFAPRGDNVLDDADHNRLWREPKEPLDETAVNTQAAGDPGLGDDDALSQHGLLPDVVFDGRLSMATEAGVRHPG